jgi:uncharacterized membrane protein YoaK (UPF0700 family)
MPLANAPSLTAADRITGALAFASGSADVFAFLKFHDVFTSAMTGNTALLGMALGQGHILEAARSLAALLGFAAGSVVGTLIHDASTTAPARSRLRRVIGVEALCLALVALLWPLLAHPVYDVPLFVLIIVASAAMGMQSVAARVIDLPGITTVVFTTTLTMIMMGLTRAVSRKGPATVKPITWRQIGVMGSYLVGAIVSGMLSMIRPDFMALPECGAVIAGFVMAEYFVPSPT